MNAQSTNDEYGQTGVFDFRHPMNGLRGGRSGGQVAQQDPDIRCRRAIHPEWGIVDFGPTLSIGCVREKRRRRDIGRRRSREWPAARGRLGGNCSLIPTSCHRLPLGTALFIIKILFRRPTAASHGSGQDEHETFLNPPELSYRIFLNMKLEAISQIPEAAKGERKQNHE